MKLYGLALPTLLLALPSLAFAARETVLPQGAHCDTENRVCLQGSIDFEPNTKIMEIRGRLYRSAGPGILTFEFFGETPLDERVFHSTRVEIRGGYSEGITHKFRPPFSNRTRWSLFRLTFEPGD